MAQYLNIPVTDLIPPADIHSHVEDWKMKFTEAVGIKDEFEKKIVINFISATRKHQ